MATHRLLIAVALGGTVVTALSDCRSEYLIQQQVLADAEQEMTRTQRPVAVPAERVREGEHLWVRYHALDLQHARPFSETLVKVSGPNQRRYRVAGPVLLSFGLALTAASLGLLGWEVSTPCDYGCAGSVSLSYGLPLGINGLGLIVWGAVLTDKGYRRKTEVPAPQQAAVYRDGHDRL
jgi:hypothetical protein